MSKRSDGLRQKLLEIARDNTIGKIDSKIFQEQKIEILRALLKLGPENLSNDEKIFLAEKSNEGMKNLVSVEETDGKVQSASKVLNSMPK